MKFPLHVKDFKELAGLSHELHLAIGMFDGVHLGHKTVIESAIFSARKSGGVSGVLTFDPHPSRLFRPDAPARLIMPVNLKLAMLDALGVDIIICKQFDHTFASISAEGFLAYLQRMLPGLKSIYVGENFRFGKMRTGSVATLIESGKQLGITVFSADRIKYNGKPISSTRIRKELEAGEIKMANDLLGYSYRSDGKIIDGKKLGHKIGFPTLNVPWSPECRPRYGVYHVRFRRPEEDIWVFGVANYGVRPTVDQTSRDPLLEVHALSDTKLKPGDQIEVEWLHFIRPEQKFGSVELLQEQIAKDCEQARTLSK
jgi:riboflavin kinase/FMN adenylyltransferase